MNKIVISIESNDIDVSNELFLLLKNIPYNCNYELDIYPVEPLNYLKPTDRPYFTDGLIYAMNFHYHFVGETGLSKPLQFNELVAFAKGYGRHIKEIMSRSNRFTERLANTANPELMNLSKLGPELEMKAMRERLMTQLSTPTHTSSMPYYLCGAGLVLAFTALTTPAGLAFALGCLSMILLIAGAAIFIKNGTSNQENEEAPRANMSYA